MLRAENYATEVGIEGFSFTNAVGLSESWSSFNGATAIQLRFCKDCWIRDVKSFARDGAEFHSRSHGIVIERSFQVTVADCHLQKAEHLGGGGDGYHYQLTRSSEVLVRDSIGHAGRHNFTINWDFGTSGDVFLRITSTGGLVCSDLAEMEAGECSTGPSDFHHALAIANLFDSAVIDDALQVGNRQDWSSGAGQTGTQNVFWNVTGTGQVHAYNQGIGYLIGTSGVDLHRPRRGRLADRAPLRRHRAGGLHGAHRRRRDPGPSLPLRGAARPAHLAVRRCATSGERPSPTDELLTPASRRRGLQTCASIAR